MTADLPKTYMTSVRADIRDLATIAKFLTDNNFELVSKTKGTLTLHALRLLADYLRNLNPSYNIIRTEEAIGVLRYLGYGESVVPGRRDYKPLLKQMAKENLQFENTQTKIISEQFEGSGPCEMQRKLDAEKELKPLSPDMPGIEEILVPTEPKPEAEPEPESPQLTIRTADDEKKDILKLRTAMNDFSGAPVLEENKTGND